MRAALFGQIRRAPQGGDTAITEPTIIAPSEHGITREHISKGALHVLDTLHEAGFKAYLVGGGVRDLLLGIRPKDFDIATEALPDEIKELFGRSCRLIGRRFRLAHVRVGREIVEVATFRGGPDSVEKDDGDHVSVNGRIVRDNVYGTLEEDAWRRDFSINCLYFEVADLNVLDFTGAVADLESRTIRMIGDPEVRYREDPVRMLRAIRFAAKLDFSLSRESERGIGACAELLDEIPPARLYDETLKLFMGGHAQATYDLLKRYRLFEFICPETDACINDIDDENGSVERFVRQALANTDARISINKAVTPAFLFAALLWEPVRRDAAAIEAQGSSAVTAIDNAGVDVLARQTEHVALPKRFSMVSREIWSMQPRLVNRRNRRANEMVSKPRFRAGYDFLLLRAEAGEPVADDAKWWTAFQEADETERARLLDRSQSDSNGSGGGGNNAGNGKKRRRRRRRRKPSQAQPA